MGKLLVRKQRRMLRGWIKWVPVIAIPFAVLFTHTWLNIQILRADYVLRETDKEVKQLQEELLYAGVVKTVKQDPDILAAQAAELGFVPPKPGQRELIDYDPTKLMFQSPDNDFAVARRAPEPRTQAKLNSPQWGTDAMEVSPIAPEAVVTPSEELDTVSLTAVKTVRETDAPVAVPIQVEVSAQVPVRLDMPEDAYVEEAPGIETDMGGLEVL
jgi:hypothetical protein